MVVEEYTLATIRDEVLDEFGLDIANATLKTKAATLINMAQQVIANSRPDWPWRLADLAVDLTPIADTVGDLLQDSTSVANTVAAVSALDILVAGAAQSRPLVGYPIVSQAGGAGTTATLFSKYRSTTEATADVTLAHGFAALPTDFAKMKVARIVQDGAEPLFENVTPLAIKEMKFRARQVDLNHQFYAVIPDPLAPDLGTSSITYYIELYPYITDRSLIAGSYWRDIPVLNADTEVPLIPREDRITLIAGGQWKMAQYLKVDGERLKSYQITFFGLLNGMKKFYNLSQDPGGVKDQIGSGIGEFIQGPAGYPVFGRSNLT